MLFPSRKLEKKKYCVSSWMVFGYIARQIPHFVVTYVILIIVSLDDV